MPLTRAAIRPAGQAEPPSALEDVREAARSGGTERLANILVEKSEPAAREAALTGLVRIGGEAAILALVGLLGSEDPALRNAVIETLPSLGDKVIDHVKPVLSDADPNLRIYALTVLQQMASPGAARTALGVALGDPNVNVCAAAIEVLAATGTADMALALRAVPDRFPDNEFLRFAVKAALEEIG